MATAKRTVAAKKAASKEAQAFDTSLLYRGILNQVEKLVGSADNMEDADPLSTGSLVHDLVLGRGVATGSMTTNSGWEQSGKTTGILHTMSEAILAGVDVIAFFDAEGSTKNSVPYMTRIMNGIGVRLTRDELFGKKDSNGEVIQHGRIYYRTVTRARIFFNWLAATLNRAPDKVRVNGKWYLVYPKDKEHASLAQYHDASTKRKDGIYIPAKHGGPAGVVFVDSWAMLNPEEKDADSGDNSLAAQARAFSAGFKRVKGLLASKKFIIYGTNQLSEIPMAMFGPKEKEVGGNALRFASDSRTRFTKRAISGAPLWPTQSKKKPGFEVERAIDGGIDGYSYTSIKTDKNKTFTTAGRVGWIRIWVRDSKGNARGFDPVFDCAHYLQLTGQLIAGGRDARNRMKLNLDKLQDSVKGEHLITWDTLKLWILGTKADQDRICKEQGFPRSFSIRAFCKKQVLSGRGDELYGALESAESKSGKTIEIVE